MWGRLFAIATLVVAVMLGATMPTSPTASATPSSRLPVGYNFFDGARAELARPGGSLPGSNDFGCKPTARHPRPVILVHGSEGGRQTNWATLVPVLANEGYCVFALTYGAVSDVWPASALGGVGPKVDSAWQIKEFADRVMAATGASQVDVVGHSLGTQIPTYWMKYLGGRTKVAHYVALAPYWRQGPDGDDTLSDSVGELRKALGVPPAKRPSCPDCVAPPKDRDFNAAVRLPTPYLPGVKYTNITTRDDEIVTPYTAGLLDGPPGTHVVNIVVQDTCPLDHSDHLSLTSNRRSAAMVLGALDPDHAPLIPCVPVLPGLGGWPAQPSRR